MAEKSYIQRAKDPQTFLLMLIALLGGFGESMYTPALTKVAATMHVSMSDIKFSVTAYIIAFALSQIFYGYLSDLFGRRRLLFIGAAIYTAGALIAAFASDYSLFILSRVLMGIGGCASSVLVRTITRDAFEYNKQRRILSIVISTVALSTLIGPIIGGCIASFSTWQNIFIFLAAFEVVTTVLAYHLLPETYHLNKNEKSVCDNWFRKSKDVLTNNVFMSHGLIAGIINGIIFTYQIESSILLIEKFHLHSYEFGFLYLINAGAYLSGSIFAASNVNKIKIEPMINLGLIIGFFGSILLFVFYLLSMITLPTILGSVGLMMFGLAITKANTATRALSPFGHQAGNASSILGLLQMGVAAIITAFLSFLGSDSAQVLVYALLIQTSLCILIHSFSNIKLSYSARASKTESIKA